MSDVVRHLLDPTSESTAAHIQRVARLDSLEGKVIGLLDIAKARGDVFLDHIAEQLTQRGAIVKRYRKTTFARLAPIDLKQRIATECQAVIEALAD